MQKHGFFFTVHAWAENLDSWLIDYGYLATWADLERLIWQALYPVQGSSDAQVLPIWRAALDTGGGKTDNVDLTRTEEAYNWLRLQMPGRVHGVKGMSHSQTRRIKPTVIDKLPHSSRPIAGGLEIRLVDSSQFKRLFHQRLDREPAEIGQHIFLHAATGADFAQQILAEELRRKGNHQEYWYQTRSANHYLDCTAYSLACVDAEWVVSFQVLARAMKAQARAAVGAPDAAQSARESQQIKSGRW
jgi:phage terminase large subunit GpA-like protein